MPKIQLHALVIETSRESITPRAARWNDTGDRTDTAQYLVIMLTPVRGALPVASVSPVNTMGTRRDHPLLTALGLLVLAAALVFVAPGALVTYAVERLLRFQLDVGQRWTWAVASSVVAACVLSLRSRDGLGRYALLAAVASEVVLVARFGTHARWAGEMLSAFAP